ncbi:family 1 glycosylhydrolase [Tunturiibacter empetritectus]|uniref:family 1 glycosylhydrolase n=1 Tax=Tunturiibacter empetritectus TaxID=3069691 RepID=UPI003D9AC302
MRRTRPHRTYNHRHPSLGRSHSLRTCCANLPQGFLWGSATASYQVEGAVNEDGRGPSIWDTFSHLPGKVKNGDTGDVANDHYHRYKEDVQLMKALGLKTYRFSVAWPRVFPQGTGTPNPKGLDFYNRLIDELLAADIQPYCTLYHWDLPQALEDKGGWQSRDTSEAFANYAGYVAGHLSDRVKYFMTLNEMSSFVNGYATGRHAPGLKLPPAGVNQVRHHAVLAHGLGVQAIRAHAKPGTRVGLAENISACVPIIETPEHIAATAKAMREVNAGYLTVIMEGRYTDAYLAHAGADAPKFTDADMKAIGTPVDFVGLNIYTPTYIRADDSPAGFARIPSPDSYPHMMSPWLHVGPEALYWGPKARRAALEHQGDLHHRKRSLFNRRPHARWPRLRLRPRHVPPQLPHAASSRSLRGRSRPWLLPLEPDGQLRVGRRLRLPLRHPLCRLRNAEAHAQGKRPLLPRSHRPQRPRLKTILPDGPPARSAVTS